MPDGVPESWMLKPSSMVGFAMGIFMDGVMGCRTSGGFMQLLYWCYDGFMGFAREFPQPLPLPTQPSCESQAHADAPD